MSPRADAAVTVRNVLATAIVSIVALAAPPARTLLAADREAPLALAATIPLDDVAGRIDHMAVDRKRQRLFVAALGNNSIEVIDLPTGRRSQRITGLRAPQGVAYAEKSDLLFVANAGDGSVRIFQAADLTQVGRIDLKDDADNVRIDTNSGNVVVGYGKGGLAVIDPDRRAVIATIPLPGHPEGFQIDPATGRAFVNVPDAGQIAVVDLARRQQVASWKVPGVGSNFPMALDPAKNVVAVVFRSPARLVLLDTRTGSVTANLSTCGDADDVFFDGKRERLYVSCGAGQVAVFQRDGEAYRSLAVIATASGARTSLFLPDLDRLFVAERAGLLAANAAIRVYQPSP